MIKIVHRLEWFVGLVLLQALVLNQMHIGGYGTPFLYIYFILKFNSKVSRNNLMLWAFMLGLSVDMFSNTPGMNAAAAVCLAFFRTTFIRLVTLRDVDDAFRPGIRTMGFSAFFRYSLLCCTLFCVLVQMIDIFSFFSMSLLVGKMLASILSTMCCVLCLEYMGRSKG